MPDLDRMLQFPSIEFFRKQIEKCSEVGFIEFFRRSELPEQGAELAAEFGDARLQKSRDRRASAAEFTPVRGVARTLQREDEVVRRFRCPTRERLRLLRAVVGAVDFDHGQLPARIAEFLGLREIVGIEDAAPRFERPAADTGANFAAFRAFATFFWRMRWIVVSAGHRRLPFAVVSVCGKLPVAARQNAFGTSESLHTRDLTAQRKLITTAMSRRFPPLM